MEISTKDFTIAVDSKEFVANPMAEITMQGAMAVLNYALMTKEHKKLNFYLVKLITELMGQYNGKTSKGWFNDNPKWGG